jgi:hypothetical protein
MYVLKPKNRYLLVANRSVKVSLQERSFVLPTDYREKDEPYKVMRVIEDSNNKYEPESLILVPTNVLEEIVIDKQKFYLVTDNYILATVTENLEEPFNANS